jgi:hypothetical protein
MSAPAGRSLSLCESTHPYQGSILSASLAPCAWHEPHGSTPTEPQAPRDARIEPTAFFQLLLQRQIRQPAARRRAGAFWEPNDGALTGSVMRQEPPSLKVKRGQVLHFAPQP